MANTHSKHKLPLLDEQHAALETCGYCPKLCRSTCPVSNVEYTDTLTPWGKMSGAWLQSRKAVPMREDYSKLAWGCTGCFACRERCDHRNPVVPTLFAARAEAFRTQTAPAAVQRASERHAESESNRQHQLETLRSHESVSSEAKSGLLLGCAYLRFAEPEAIAAIEVVAALRGKLRLLDGCCGAPYLHAGDRQRFVANAQTWQGRVQNLEELVVLDPGCALVLTEFTQLSPAPVTLVSLAAQNMGRFRHGAARSEVGQKYRWHDNCQLGRGLGQYEEPRELLAHCLGTPALEFTHRRAHAACSGAGALLPISMPDTSRRIAETRISEHAELGGGKIVTACASSLRRFRSLGAEVLDLATILRAGL